MNHREIAVSYLESDIETLEDALLDSYSDSTEISVQGEAEHEKEYDSRPNRNVLDALLAQAKNIINESPQQFRDIICKKLNYCDNINSDKASISIAIVDTALITKLALLFPPLLVSVYIIRKGLLDDLCGCS